MKRIMIIAAVAAALCSVSCNGAKGKSAVDQTENPDSTMIKSTVAEPVFDIQTNMGTIRIKLYSKTPKHRDNFVRLASEHFYDSLLFHRVIEGFMIQGGDPNTRDTSKVAQYGQGGPGYTIPAEFVPEYYHKKGALAAARMGDFVNPSKASSGSQFYIVQDEMNCIHLDGEYTVFGETVQGLDVIDRIASVPVNAYDLPVEPVRIISVTPVEETVPAAGETVPAAEETEKVEE